MTNTIPHASLLPLQLRDVALVFLDLETTGLQPHLGDRICEVALLRVRDGVVEGHLDRLIDPQRPLGALASAVTGISAEQLASAPVFSAIADELLPLLSGAILVAHNAPFDVEFLQAELALAGRPALDNPVIDTLPLARRLLPKRQSYSLAGLAAALNVQPPTHRAMADVLALRAVFDDLTERLEALGITTLGETLRYARGFRPGEPEPAAPLPIAEALRDGRLLRISYVSVSSPEPTERVIRPIEITNQRGSLFLRAYCYLRNDLRVFALRKIVEMAPVE